MGEKRKNNVRAGGSKRPTIRFTRARPVPVESGGFAVFNLDGTPQQVRVSWRATVQQYRLWCFNSTADRYQFGHPDRRSTMLPPSGHFLVYLHYMGNWLCAVINGPTGYLDGYITQSTGDNLRVMENRPENPSDTATYIEDAELLPWDGGYVFAASCELGHPGLTRAFPVMFKFVHGVGSEHDYKEVTAAGETIILHLSEPGRSDELYFVIDSNFIIGRLLGSKLLAKARNWRSKSEKPLEIMEEVYSSVADRRNPKRVAKIAKSASKSKRILANKRAVFADSKEKMTDTMSADEKNGKMIEEEEFGIKLKAELNVLEDIRLLHRPDSVREIFHLNQLLVHLEKGRPVNNALDRFLEPQKPNLDSHFLVKPFKQFVRSYRKKKMDEETGLDLETSGMDLFAEDISEMHIRSMGMQSAGIQNMGNTCYASSSLQCLHAVPEIKYTLYSYPDNVQGNAAGKASHDLTLATKSIFNELDHSDLPVLPVHFLETLRESVPQFKEKEGDTDIYRQQDAEECWSYLVNTLSETLSSEPSDPAAQPIKKLFEIEFLKRDRYEVNGDETTAFETTYNLGCPISDDVKDLREGIKLHLNSEVEKILDNGQPAHYKSKLAINKLPCYLVIQFGRICTEGGEQRKIKDEVPYPLELNVLEFCSDELKQKIHSCQQGLIGAENAGGTSLDGHVMSSTADMCTDGSSPTGLYDLVALVTHDGDTPNSGHYVAWVKQEGGYWTEYDDAFATEHKEEDESMWGRGWSNGVHVPIQSSDAMQ